MEEKNQLIKCNVTILGRKYKYAVSPEDEIPVRDAMRGVLEKLAELKQQRAFQDNQELVTVALVQLAIEKTKQEMLFKNLMGELGDMDALLDDYIKTETVK